MAYDWQLVLTAIGRLRTQRESLEVRPCGKHSAMHRQRATQELRGACLNVLAKPRLILDARTERDLAGTLDLRTSPPSL